MTSVNAWFWSSVEPALFQRSTFREMAARGVTVRQAFTVSEIDFRRHRGLLGRIVLRARMYAEHPLRLAWAILTADPADVHIVTTNPFFAPAVALLVARGGRVVHLVYDLFPDALIVAGKVSVASPSTQLVRRIVRAIFDRAAVNVFIGQWLHQHASESFGPIPRAVIIPVGADAGAFGATAPTPPEPGARVDVLYSGTLGSMHDTETLLGALGSWARVPRAATVRITFHAFGPGYSAFGARVRALSGVGDLIRLEGALPDSEWVRRMRAAHVALVTMKAGSERIVMPSKAYSALAAGQAILAICPRRSDLADLVESRDCGWVVPPGDIEGLSQALDELSVRPDVLQRKRENAFRAGQSEFGEAAMAARWCELLRNGREEP